MKKSLSLTVSIALLLALLPGCGEKEDQVVPVEAEASVPVETAELPDVRTLAEAGLLASGKEEALEVERLDRETDADRLAAYIEAVCGLAPEAWEDAAVIRGMGASAFEIVVLRLEDEDARLAALRHIGEKKLTVAATEEYIEIQLQKKQMEGKEKKRLFIIKDVRLFLNSVDRGMETIRRAGVDARFDRQESEEEITITIQIPKQQAIG